ncbi:MAG: T9SS type A sorting domain-containing protein [Saprospiraceae bacterium]|nr:T9SS type A sorting domain-containing protein [Saprospiraceae bacterium]
MKKIILYLFTISISFNLQAQNIGCDDSNRYVDDIFAVVQLTSNLKFGEGETIFGNFKELFLDVYEPVGDDLEERPVIILAFGGSFIGGSKEDVSFLCESYARKGYVAVAIDYRLYDGPLLPLPNAEQMTEVVIKTVSDMKASIRYMREDAATENKFRIDTDLVFVGGVSAGGITAFHTAVLDDSDNLPDNIRMIIDENGGLEGNSSDNFQYSSAVQGIVNFSGGLNDASWIDAEDPPFVSIHDDMDGVVPYAGGFAKVFDFPIIYMEGSKSCQLVGDSLGVVNQLKTIENSDGHVSYFASLPEITTNINYTTDFLVNIVCQEGTTSTSENTLESVQIYPNPTSGPISISNLEDQNISVDLYDLMGRKLATFGNSTSIDLSNFSNGMYLINIVNKETASVNTTRIIIER